MQPAVPITPERAREYLSQQSQMQSGVENTWVMFALELKGHRRVIGEAGIFLFNQDARLGNMGWFIHPDFQRRHYATEAAGALLAYAFEDQELHRVTASCLTTNEPSFRLMQRIGMRREGHMRKSRKWRDAWLDEYAYALLREEWVKS